MRTLLLAGLLAAAAAPVAAGAQHAAAPAVTKPADKADKAAKAGMPEKSVAAAKKSAPMTELEAAFDRIAQKIDGAAVMTGGLRISSASSSRAADTHASEPRAARPEATPRIHLNWRSSVVWPAAFADAHNTGATPGTPRIALTWP